MTPLWNDEINRLNTVPVQQRDASWAQDLLDLVGGTASIDYGSSDTLTRAEKMLRLLGDPAPLPITNPVLENYRFMINFSRGTMGKPDHLDAARLAYLPWRSEFPGLPLMHENPMECAQRLLRLVTAIPVIADGTPAGWEIGLAEMLNVPHSARDEHWSNKVLSILDGAEHWNVGTSAPALRAQTCIDLLELLIPATIHHEVLLMYQRGLAMGFSFSDAASLAIESTWRQLDPSVPVMPEDPVGYLSLVLALAVQ